MILSFLIGTAISIAQTPQDQFNKAKELYDNGNNKDCIVALQAVEKQVDANPRIYSLYINAYVADKDYTNAAISLNKFKKLVDNKRTDAIQSILDLEKEINSGVETAEKKHKATVDKKRMAEADKIIAASKQKNQQTMQELTGKYEMEKNALTQNADAETIKQNFADLSFDKKMELLKTLRKSKKIKESWQVQFADKELMQVVAITYHEYNADGSLSKTIVKNFGDTYNTIFNTYPLFDEKMISRDYISQIENSANYTKKFTYSNSSNEEEKYKFKKSIVKELQSNRVISVSTQYLWSDKWTDNPVKDSTYYSNQTASGANVSNYTYDGDKIKSQKWQYYNGNKFNGYRFEEYQYISPMQATITVESKNANGVTDYFKEDKKFSFLGDLTEYTYSRNGKTELEHSENSAYSYERYGNISYKHYRYNGFYKTINHYFYYFYSYQDGFSSGSEDFNKGKKYNSTKQKPKYTQQQLVNIFNNATNEYSKYRYENAYILLKQGAEADKPNPEFLNMMAYSYYEGSAKKIEHLEKAIGYLDEALKMDPYYFNAYHSKADLYYRSGNKEKAMDYYKIAADWGVYASVIKLKNNFNINYKPDSQLLIESDPDEHTITQGVYRRITGDCSTYIKIVIEKDKMILYGLDSPNSNTYTYSEIYKRSKKNSAVFIYSKNNNSKMIYNNHQLRLYTENKYCGYINYEN